MTTRVAGHFEGDRIAALSIIAMLGGGQAIVRATEGEPISEQILEAVSQNLNAHLDSKSQRGKNRRSKGQP